MTHWTRHLACCIALLCSACSALPGEDPGGQTDPLIGGHPAATHQFPSAVILESADSFCTAAKVGPRHILTAAHCVHDVATNQVRAGYAPGASIWLYRRDSSDVAEVTVAATFLPPAWQSACDTNGTGFCPSQSEPAGCTCNVLGPDAPPDVAVVLLNEDTPDIPRASVDLRGTQIGDPVVVMGYGCEHSVTQSDDPLSEDLKIQETALIDPAVLDAPDVFPDVNRDLVAASFILTPGRSGHPGQAGLCPGDSGGPLFRDDGTESHVVGVNAYYSFADDDPGVPIANWHTRLDDDSRFGVGDWLVGLGVDHVSTLGCAARCCDGTLVHTGDQPDAGQCTFWGGFGCQDNGGPVRVRYEGDLVWQSDQAECPTMRSCSVRCCDDTLVTGAQHFDPNMCTFFEAPKCDGHGGALRVRYDEEVIWEADEYACVSPTSCSARCCDGTLVHTGPQPDGNQCIFWGGFGCGNNGGPVRVRYGGDLVWQSDQAECPTMRSCSVRCCDDTLVTGAEHFDQNMCIFFEAPKCDGHGGALRVRYDGDVVWQAASCN